MEQTKIYEIKPTFAKNANIPAIFIGKVLTETARALYIYGHGTIETSKTGKCCVCGRTLTHPVSVILGIGPECGSHFWDWNVIGGYTEGNLKMVKDKISEQKVDQWLPKSVVKQEYDTETEVVPPTDHKMLNQSKEEMKTKEKTATQIQYKDSGKVGIKIEFPFNMETVQAVKKLPWRKYHPDGKFWSCPVSKEAVQILKDMGFKLDDKLSKFLEFRSKTVQEINKIEHIPGLQGVLMEYQKYGVSFVHFNDGRALIGDEMGLGKTIQALAYLQLHKKKRPVLIVVPSNMKTKWMREALKWLSVPGEIQILKGKKPNVPIIGDIVIVNYDILYDWKKILNQVRFQVMITDECHYYKENAAKRTKAVKFIAKKIPHFIALSGTPIDNRPKEIYNAVNIINPMIFPNFMEFGKKFCNGKHNGYGWDFNGASNIPELHQILTSSVMIRRKKKDVLKDLPDKTYSYNPLEIDNRKDYTQAVSDFIGYIRETKGDRMARRAAGAETLSKIEMLKQLAVHGKLKHTIEWVKDFLESGEKLVVFAWHTNIIKALNEAFPDISVVVDGHTANKDKEMDKFQTDPECKLFIGQMKAAGIGIELTAASHVAIVELPWTPGTLDQAIDRLHRIGQEFAVTVYYLLAQDTIEETIAHLIDKKRNIVSQALDGVEAEQESLIGELLDTILN
jgi:SWI/SNF-related matrix-associated actin-dependent regulator 1 of chromatin subfamily A